MTPFIARKVVCGWSDSEEINGRSQERWEDVCGCARRIEFREDAGTRQETFGNGDAYVARENFGDGVERCCLAFAILPRFLMLMSGVRRSGRTWRKVANCGAFILHRIEREAGPLELV